MYRYISLLLAVILAASLISCSDSNKNTGTTDTTNGKEETTVSTNDVTTTPEDTTDTDSGTDTSTNDTTTTPEATTSSTDQSTSNTEAALLTKFSDLLYLCDQLGEFNTADEISGLDFYFAVRFDIGHIKEEHYYHEDDVNQEFPHPIYTYDITSFDALSLQLFDTTFEYAALEEGHYSFYEYTYKGEEQLIIEKITGFGGGPDDVMFSAVYDGYETVNGKYVVSAHYTAENLEGAFWDTDITAEMTVEVVDGTYKIRSYVINGDFSTELEPPID